MRSVFAARSTTMARIPLTPTAGPPPPGLLAEGIFLASRSLDNAAPRPRAATARTAYALRAATRTTPNGVWSAAGTAVLDSTTATSIAWSGEHRTHTVPAPPWLLAVADQHLETALDRLTVSANNLAVRRGARWQAAHPGTADGEAVLGSVTATDLSDWVLATCSAHVSVEDLVTRIHQRYPTAGLAKARTALAGLVRTGLLLTDLLPEDLRVDPLQHLADRLGVQHPVSSTLLELRALLCEADTHRAGSSRRLQLLRQARALADDLYVVEQPFTVDTVLTDDLRVPAAVGHQAAEAASLLWHIGHRVGPLQHWTRRFTDIFGRTRLVPLLEAVDPVAGAGPPAPEDAIGAGSTLDEARARHLAALHGDALVRGRPEIALTDDDLRQLLTRDDSVPPATAEIHVRLVSQPDGMFSLVVGPHAAQDAGSAAARLNHLLPDLHPFPAPPAIGQPVVAEIVCRPLTARTATLTPASGTLPHRIPIGVPARDGDLLPADLAIASTATGLIVWSRQLDAPVRPVLLSRITRDLLPPAAQLLHLLGHVGERPWHPFTWTPAVPYAAYTPRVTFRGTVLAPQRWMLPDALVRASARRETWTSQLEAWIGTVRPRLPAAVLAEESDRHLLIDITDPEHREILRRSIAAGTRTLAEAHGYTPAHAPV
ncbi:MAG: lantibiotic dehydratase family protein, partial [Streptomyces sp.]|nr:lantibiotic dehydratase family protein [Streptomyces sp.]